ncbi:MAG: hypothetical protein QNJ34_26175 [Xenococcaceae cyanobacterium MO_188.B29]|nr:hypothetical protein [Xenococcaceae cyanobacterium MO_188.B29]
MKNSNLEPIMPFVFYLIAIAIGFDVQINSIVSSQLNHLASNPCAQVYNKN